MLHWTGPTASGWRILTARSPLVSGVVLALAAAVSFGASAPFVHRFGAGVGAFSTACLLYAGAGMAAVAWPSRAGLEARVRLRHGPRVLAVAVAGAVVAPTALAWGLQRADATSASLLLNFEAVFTVLLARFVFGESLGGRVGLAAVLMVAGGCVLVAAGPHETLRASWGLGAVLLAAMAWAADNALTRPLSDLDPVAVVARKGLLGAALTLGAAVAFREPFPSPIRAVALLVCGATGYGVSLRLYLLAQRRVGAARTASVFAVAPFVGALLAWGIGDGRADVSTLLAGALFGVAVCLHLYERHGHAHTHELVEHEHAHRHGDAHHDHAHDPPVAGVHSHPHRHAPVTHAHEHAPDLHHGHRH